MADIRLSISSDFNGKGFVDARASIKNTGREAERAMISAAESMKAASAATLLLQGNFSGALKSAIALAGQMKILSGLATLYASVGLMAVQYALAFIERRAKKAQEELEKLSRVRLDGFSASAKDAAKAYEQATNALQQQIKLMEIAHKLGETVAGGENTLEGLELEKERQRALAGASSTDEAAAINKAYDARKKLMDIRHQEEKAAREAAMEDARAEKTAQRRTAVENRISQIAKDKKAVMAELAKWEEAYDRAKAERETGGSTSDDANRWLARAYNAFGGQSASTAEKWEDYEKRVEKAKEELKKQIDDLERAEQSSQSDLAGVEADEKSAEVARARIENARQEVAAKRELAELELQAAENAARIDEKEKRRAENEKERLKTERELEAQERKLGDLKERNAANEERREEEAMRRRLDEARRIAGMSADELVEKHRKEREDAKASAKEDRRQRLLESKVADGVQLSRKDREWLDARHEIAQANKAAAAEAAALQAKEDARQAAVIDSIKKCGEEVSALKEKLVEITTCQ